MTLESCMGSMLAAESVDDLRSTSLPSGSGHHWNLRSQKEDRASTRIDSVLRDLELLGHSDRDGRTFNFVSRQLLKLDLEFLKNVYGVCKKVERQRCVFEPPWKIFIIKKEEK
ncbi:hypothetical protein ACH5RR_028446 [Cinchona calisaya]|uniref:Uncharacterized protein n=1 Tax=Cinchona calisaya TaxID=153742 RepID=A0ABD2YNT3_9GENT